MFGPRKRIGGKSEAQLVMCLSYSTLLAQGALAYSLLVVLCAGEQLSSCVCLNLRPSSLWAYYVDTTSGVCPRGRSSNDCEFVRFRTRATSTRPTFPFESFQC